MQRPRTKCQRISRAQSQSLLWNRMQSEWLCAVSTTTSDDFLLAYRALHCISLWGVSRRSNSMGIGTIKFAKIHKSKWEIRAKTPLLNRFPRQIQLRNAHQLLHISPTVQLLDKYNTKRLAKRVDQLKIESRAVAAMTLMCDKWDVVGLINQLKHVW